MFQGFGDEKLVDDIHAQIRDQGGRTQLICMAEIGGLDLVASKEREDLSWAEREGKDLAARLLVGSVVRKDVEATLKERVVVPWVG